MPQPTAIVAWRKLSRRSQLLAQALSANLYFIKDRLPYLRATLQTLLKMARAKPKVLIVQLPQGPLLLVALILKKLIACKIVADVHTGFLLNEGWKGLLLNTPFVGMLSKADLIIAHNEKQLQLIPKKIQGKTLVVYDPWHLGTQETQPTTAEGNYLVFPASFAPDEPLEEVINTIDTFNLEVKMYITGNWKRKPEIKKYASERIIFTGFLPTEEYNNLLAKSTAVITGTKREYTALMSGWEAIAHGKPLAVTSTRTLKDLFGNYAIFYDYQNTQSIAEAIRKILESKPNMLAREKLKQRTVASLEELKRKISELK